MGNTFTNKRLFTLLIWAVIIAAIIAAPSLLPSFRLNLLGRYLSLAIVALGVDLIWGYTGLLSLGQGIFLSLVGYCATMFLQLNSATNFNQDLSSWDVSSVLDMAYMFQAAESFNQVDDWVKYDEGDNQIQYCSKLGRANLIIPFGFKHFFQICNTFEASSLSKYSNTCEAYIISIEFFSNGKFIIS